jgi:hypothetical protein
MKNWEIIADNLSKAGWSWGCVSAIDSEGEQSGLLTRIVTESVFIVRADEKLTAFVELESIALAMNCLDGSARFFKLDAVIRI